MVSILDSVKQMLGIESEDTSFDKELIMHTNGALMVMTQLGVGPVTGFSISDKEQNWAEFLQDRTDMDLVFNDVYLRVKLIFDPPQNSFLVNSINNQIKEYDWRIEAWHDPVMSKPETYTTAAMEDDDFDDDDFSVAEEFAQYRKNVVRELGAETDNRFYYGANS